MELHYTVRGADGKDYGPVELEQLRQWIGEGRVRPAQQVRRSDMEYWAAASEFQEFQDLYFPGAATSGAGAAGGTATATKAVSAAAVTVGSLAQIKSAGAWFYWVAGLSLVNSVAAFTGLGWRFILGLGITEIFNGVGSNMESGGKAIVFLLDVLAAGVLVTLGFFAQKAHLWAFITGMLLLALDGIIFVVAQDWLGVAFHIFVLYCLFRGVAACRAASR